MCLAQQFGRADTDYDDYGGGYKPLGGLVGLCGAALCLLVPVVLVVVLVLRRRKRRRAAEETPVVEPIAAAEEMSMQQPAAIPAAPLLSEPFNSLERRHAQLKQAYAAGPLSQDAYHRALRQLVVQDARGHWAFSSGRWMWFDGTQWVPRHPL